MAEFFAELKRRHTRRQCLSLAGRTAVATLLLPTTLGAATNSGDGSEIQRRIGQIIHEFEEQGFHRTGTEVDKSSGEWLVGKVREIGLDPIQEAFKLSRVDPIAASILLNGRKIEGIPLFDGGFTGSASVRGRFGDLASDAPIGLTEIPPNTAEIGALGEARKQNRHQAIVVVTRGSRPGLCPSNAESFLHPFGPPILQVASEEAPFLAECARQGLEGLLTAQVDRTQAEAFNVTATIPGANSDLAPLVIMTPRSGWWSCASERGGGLACWLEIMRAMRDSRPVRDILFVASSGHEIGERGIEIFIEHRPGTVTRAKAWVHLGANIGAAQGPGNRLQASDDEMESIMAEVMTKVGLRIDRRIPRGTVPAGEAAHVHRAGGRYMSIIGSNELFHNPQDRGSQAIDLNVIERFAGVFSMVSKSLTSV